MASARPTAAQWIVVDCGVTVRARDATRRASISSCRISAFWRSSASDVLGIVATHAHEDHIGAIAPLWPMLRCPIYATPFTARLIEGKLEEAGLRDGARSSKCRWAAR